MAERDSNGLKVIQVNGDFPQLQLVKIWFEHKGHAVDSFINPEDALKEVMGRLRTYPPGVDLIITNGEMPGMNGGEFAARIREIPQGGGLPIILISGKAGEFRRKFSRTVDVFVEKPYNIETLTQAAGSALEMAAKRKPFL